MRACLMIRISLFCLSLAPTARAGVADRTPRVVHWSVRGGMNRSHLQLEERMPGVIYDCRLGLCGEGLRIIPLSGVLRLEVGLGLSTKGETTGSTELVSDPDRPEGRAVTVRYTESERTSYLTVPIALRSTIGRSDWRPFVRGGVELSRLIRAEAKASVIILGRKRSSMLDVRSLYKSTDLGVLAGAGIEKDWGRGAGFAEIGYVLGLFNMNDSFNRDTQTIRNRTLQLSLGYRL
jgi:hypothetical protein